MPETPGIYPGVGTISSSSPSTSVIPVVPTPGIEGVAANEPPRLSQHHAVSVPLTGLMDIYTGPSHSIGRFADLTDLFSPTRGSSSYQTLQRTLVELGYPTGDKGLSLTYSEGTRTIRLHQPAADGAIHVELQKGASQKSIQLRYLPNQTILDVGSRAEAVKQPKQLSGKARGVHFVVFESLQRRIATQNQAILAYERLNGQLRQIKPSEITKDGTRWHHGIVAHEGKVYSFSSQQALHTPLGLYELLEDGTHKKILHLAANGEVHSDKHKQVLNPEELRVLNQVHGQLQGRFLEPSSFRPGYYQQLSTSYQRAFGSNHSFTIPTADIIPIPNFNLSTTIQTEGEVFHNINNGSKLFRESVASFRGVWAVRRGVQAIRNGEALRRGLKLFYPSANSNSNSLIGYPTELRLAPVVRRAMFFEAFRYGWNYFNSFLSDPLGTSVQLHDSVDLHVRPEGEQRVEFYRGGQLHNLVTKQPGQPTINLDKKIRAMQRADPTLFDRPRAYLLSLANRDLASAPHTSSSNSRGFSIQVVPPISLELLAQTANNSGITDFTSARAAWATIESLPGMKGLKTRVKKILPQETPRSADPQSIAANSPRSLGRLALEVNIPHSHPRTRLQLRETNQRGLFIEVVRGTEVTRAVFRNGTYLPEHSTQLDIAAFHQASQGHYAQSLPHRIARVAARNYAYWRANGQTYFFGHFSSMPFIYGAERLFLSEGERKLIGTPLPDLSGSGLGQEGLVAGAMLTGSGIGAIAVDGAFNYTSGLKQVALNYRGSGASLASVFRVQPPYLFNRIPILSRPIPKTAWYARGIAQRIAPLLGGLMAVDMLQRGSLIPALDERTVEMAMRIGAVSTATSSFFALGQYSLEKAVTHGMVAQGLFGKLYKTGGKKFWGGFFADAKKFSFAGSSYFNTFRCQFLTITLELIALKLWDTYDRKAMLVDHETQIRKGLAFAIDQYNRKLSRVALGEDIPMAEIQEAQQEVRQNFRRYGSYLKMMEREMGDKDFDRLKLHNNYEPENFSLGFQSRDPIKHIQLRQKEDALKAKREQIYAQEGQTLSPAKPKKSPETLFNFLKRMQAEAKDSQPTYSPIAKSSPPFSLESPQAERISEFLSEQLSQSQNFWQRPFEEQAKTLVRQFSGFVVQTEGQAPRSWNHQDAQSMLSALLEENERRLNEMETPLIKPKGDVNRMMKQWDQIAQTEAEVFNDYEKGNSYFANLTGDLASNREDLEAQMEVYLEDSDDKLKKALENFFISKADQELSADNSQRLIPLYEQENFDLALTPTSRTL